MEAESSAAGAAAGAAAAGTAGEGSTVAPLEVVYCGVCSLPPEYCEFGATVKKCMDWLEGNHPSLHQKLYSSEALESKMGTMTLEAQQKAEKDLAKKQQKEELRQEREAAKKKSSVITIKRVERTKRKYVTVVSGIEAFELVYKTVAKEFGKKFACGSSVTKSAAGSEEITVQGDLSDEILEELVEKYGIDEDNIRQVEETKKKGGSGPS
ncbi:Translation machinery-associated protein 22 [Orbilia oligospora]|uniref:Translation machinery-associated protein 22 n=1 Tax=Orbilia oligospora TaxID=2813651 RepID=A0A7C8NL58_ORBOL|nr:Translation machinery-associated protein 22 [Orbilia oligospora]KAF3113917.1 Translation machinery-associated protein 22 [Orbilia oligospora]KAF3116771.1 Translation machinery-associated protein 22 [Orbilia oligospora]KAF3123536.1 Translation machinery-associated protein 22 [Orbilia oligospora]KAF3139275.1 Translation machinery-associated protein 22 [Orbilia oligospora]